MKDFIRDEGKVRACTSNIAKMNILEWMWYRQDLFVDQLYEGTKSVFYGFVGLLLLISIPIRYPISAYIDIKHAKEEMKEYNRK